MRRLLLLRHGPTAWNAERRLQGRADLPLDADGETQVRRWRLPAAFAAAGWLSSPLLRARMTAHILAGREVATDDRLIEMDWGAFEGRTLAEIRASERGFMAEAEARGLDFRPPGGESPRDVGARLEALLAELRLDDGPLVLVAHKGTQHAALALATGWDMTTRPPARPGADRALLLDLAGDGGLTLAGTPSLLPP